jgi:hypothetical protein
MLKKARILTRPTPTRHSAGKAAAHYHFNKGWVG